MATVFVAGRPMYMNRELNRSDGFVAAWLPGTEGDGVADLLVKGRHTGPGFTGKLSYSWPATPCETPLNRRRGLRAAVQAVAERTAAQAGVADVQRRLARLPGHENAASPVNP